VHNHRCTIICTQSHVHNHMCMIKGASEALFKMSSEWKPPCSMTDDCDTALSDIKCDLNLTGGTL
jgi:hypothetical protein